MTVYNRRNYNCQDRVMTFGLTDEQNKLVARALPGCTCHLYDADDYQDLIALRSTALIIDASALTIGEVGTIWEYYTDIDCCTDETVFWLGIPRPPKSLHGTFKCYDDFDALATDLKYHLLKAHRKTGRIKTVSNQLTDCMYIMRYIRTKPYIRTRDLAEKLSISERTVQRYIATLRDAGEWISYDTEKKGWYLQFEKSPYFDNF